MESEVAPFEVIDDGQGFLPSVLVLARHGHAIAVRKPVLQALHCILRPVFNRWSLRKQML